MVYLKSVLVGLVAMLLALIGFVAVVMFWATRGVQGAVSVDVIYLVGSPLLWLIVVGGFAAGFWWEFRRASR